MSETKTTRKSPGISLNLIGVVMTTATMTFFTSTAAWCFLSILLGLRSFYQHNTTAVITQIDALRISHTLVSPPDWINKIDNFYIHWHDLAAKNQGTCFDTSALSKSLPYLQLNSPAASTTTNPFTQQLTRICLMTKSQILPLLSGSVAIVALRFWVFITSLPLLLLSLAIGLIDGLVQRDIRKFQGARETTLFFHSIKQCGSAMFCLPLLAYLAWLSPASALWFITPMAVALGIWLALSIRFFKKYV